MIQKRRVRKIDEEASGKAVSTWHHNSVFVTHIKILEILSYAILPIEKAVSNKTVTKKTIKLPNQYCTKTG